MALAQLVTQTPGTLIKSGDWNAEFQNILTNPIQLFSPTTGAINFNLQSHSGLLPVVISASSGTVGQAIVVSGGVAAWGTPTVTGSGVSVSSGSTGQVLAVTSSNSPAAFQVLPIDGGLSTTPPTGGMTYSISTGATTLKGLAIGSSGQVYMTGTSGGPLWSNLTSVSGGSGGSVSLSSASITAYGDDFYGILTSGITNFTIATYPGFMTYSPSTGSPALASRNTPNGSVNLNAAGTLVANVNSTAGTIANAVVLGNDATFSAIFGLGTSAVARKRIGLVGTTGTNPYTLTATVAGSLANDALYFDIITTGSSGTVNAVSRVGGLEFTIATTATLTAGGSWTFGKFVATSSATSVVVTIDGITAGTFTSSQVPTSTMQLAVAFGSSGSNNHLDAWQVTMIRPLTL